MKFCFLLILLCLSLPGFGQEDDQLLEQLESDRKKQLELAQKHAKINQNLDAPVYNAPLELQKLGYKTLDVAALTDERVVQIVQKMLKDNPLSKIPPKEAEGLLIQQMGDSYAATWLSEHPRVMRKVTAILQDKDALSSAVGIFLKKGDLQIYFFIWLCLMILSWLFKKIFFEKSWGRGKTFLMSVLVSLFVTGVSLGTFYKMFRKELSPAVAVLMK